MGGCAKDNSRKNWGVAEMTDTLREQVAMLLCHEFFSPPGAPRMCAHTCAVGHDPGCDKISSVADRIIAMVQATPQNTGYYSGNVDYTSATRCNRRTSGTE